MEEEMHMNVFSCIKSLIKRPWCVSYANNTNLYFHKEWVQYYTTYLQKPRMWVRWQMWHQKTRIKVRLYATQWAFKMNNQKIKRWEKTARGPHFTWLHHWHQHRRRSCWPAAHRSLSGRPPWWWCGRWTRWKQGRYRSRRWPEPLPFLFRSETENLRIKESRRKKNKWLNQGMQKKQEKKKHHYPKLKKCHAFFCVSAGGWRGDSNMWRAIKTRVDLSVTHWTWQIICSKSTLIWLMLLRRIPAAFNSSTHLWPSFWVSTCCRAATWAHTPAQGHIKRAQRLWNRTFQASFPGSRTFVDLISTARYLFLRWAVAERVSLWNLNEQKCYFQQKVWAFLSLPEPVTKRGVCWLPRGDGFKSIADENEPKCRQTQRRKRKIMTPALLTPAFFKPPDLNFKHKPWTLQFFKFIYLIWGGHLSRPGGVLTL